MPPKPEREQREQYEGRGVRAQVPLGRRDAHEPLHPVCSSIDVIALSYRIQYGRQSAAALESLTTSVKLRGTWASDGESGDCRRARAGIDDRLLRTHPARLGRETSRQFSG